MDKIFILRFAFRNLKLHRLRTILTLLGVIIGISAIVFLVSFAYGVERLVTQEITGGNAFLLIDVGTGNSQIVTMTDSTVASIKGIKDVKNVYGMVTVGAKSTLDNKTTDVSFYGTDQNYLSQSAINVAKGSNLSGSGNELLINTSYLDFLNLSQSEVIGKELKFDIVIPRALGDTADNTEFKDQTFKIVGVINDVSSPKVYTNYANLRALGVDSFSQIKVEINSKNQAAEIRKAIENLGLKTQYVGDTVTQVSSVFGIFRAVLAAFGLITLIVALLGMFNTLTISLLERIKEVALMKMLGMRKKDINNIFLTESILLGFSGGIFGLVLGILAGKLANAILNHYALSLGGQSVSVFYSPTIFIVIIVAVSLLIGFLTGLYPARRAVKVNSLDVLRYE